MSEINHGDPRIEEYIHIVKRLMPSASQLEFDESSTDAIDRLGEALHTLARTIELRQRQDDKLAKITAQINSGLLFEEVMDSIYTEFREVIPYNRMGVATIEEQEIVRAIWAKSDHSQIRLSTGYTQPLSQSSLKQVLATGRPRILNDLVEYQERKPDSHATRLIIEEGMRSSLTCPLVANGVPLGFLFFSSVNPKEYANVHVETFERIAGDLSIILEKSRLVSELASRNAEIEQQNQQLQRLIELRNVILGMVSHDLRSPLSFIQTTVDLMSGSEKSKYEKHQLKFAEGISRQVRRMKALLNDLLDFTLMEAGKFELQLEYLDLPALLEEAASFHNHLAANQRTKIHLDVNGRGHIYADPARLRQVMDNLVTNAIKFSPPQSLVNILATQEARGWKVCVIDQGPGITENDRKVIFQAFSQLSAQAQSGEKGTGLGLAISRWIVEAHGGEIGVDSTTEQGAVFWFTLPELAEPDGSIDLRI